MVVNGFPESRPPVVGSQSHIHYRCCGTPFGRSSSTEAPVIGPDRLQSAVTNAEVIIPTRSSYIPVWEYIPDESREMSGEPRATPVSPARAIKLELHIDSRELRRRRRRRDSAGLEKAFIFSVNIMIISIVVRCSILCSCTAMTYDITGYSLYVVNLNKGLSSAISAN